MIGRRESRSRADLAARRADECNARHCGMRLHIIARAFARPGMMGVEELMDRSTLISVSSRGRMSQDVTPLFLAGLGGFPGQALSPQSFVVLLKGFLCFLVFRDGLSLAGSLESLPRLSLRGCDREVLVGLVVHGSPLMSVTDEPTIARPRNAASKPAH